MLLELALLAASIQKTPDFSGVIGSPKMTKRAGPMPLLVILWDPERPDHPAPSKQQIEELVFGRKRSVAGWWRENSGGRCTLERAGLLGWFKSDFGPERYWGTDPEDKDKNGFVTGHVEKWAEAVRRADEEFDFARYDKNRNKVLEPTELAVLVVIPQNGPFGTMRTPAGKEVPKWEPLVVDGVSVPLITEAYAGNPLNLGLFAHELSHLILGAPDMYRNSKFRALSYSLMDSSYGTVHLGPFEKLKLGWLRPRIVSRSGTFRLSSVERSGEALILFDSERGPGEYFILENRWRRGSYDLEGLPSDGLAVWHVLEDSSILARYGEGGDPGDWGRRGVRLIRRNEGSPVDDAQALFSRGDDLRVTWADGSDSKFRITVISEVGPTMSIRVEFRS